MDHGVNHLGITKLNSTSQSGRQMRGSGHVLHTAGNDRRRIAAANCLIGQHHGLESRSADFVDRHRRDRRRKAGFERGLASRGLADTGSNHIAHDDFVNVGWGNARPGDRLLDRNPAKLSCR